MKFQKTALLLSLSAMAFGANAAGEEGHGTVTFTGEIIEGACSITPDSVDQTVDLGQVSMSSLEDGGQSQAQPFAIHLVDCDLTSLTEGTVGVTFTGTASSDVDGALAITGTASGAGVFILDSAGDAVELGVESTAQTIAAGENDLNFTAYLQGAPNEDDGSGEMVSPVVAGEFTATTNFSLAYQ